MQLALKARKHILMLSFVFNNSHWLIHNIAQEFGSIRITTLYSMFVALESVPSLFCQRLTANGKVIFFLLNCCLEFSNKPTSQEFNQQHKLLRAVLKAQTAHFRCNCPHPLKNICTFVFSDSDVGQEDLDDAAWLVSPM